MKTDWTDSDILALTDFDRIEQELLAIKEGL